MAETTSTPIAILKADAQPTILRVGTRSTIVFITEVLSMINHEICCKVRIRSAERSLLYIDLESDIVLRPSTITTLKEQVEVQPNEEGCIPVEVTVSDSVPPPPSHQLTLRVKK